MRLRLGLLAAAASVALLSFGGVADAKTFRYATTGDILGIDPHANNEGPTNAMKSNIYGRLVHRKPDLSLEPDLATEWEKIDDVTWRFKLREGVKFHNGNDFNADDVVYSYQRQKQDASSMAFVLATVEDVKKVDDYTVDIITKGPDPILMLNMPNFYMVDKETIEAAGAFEIIDVAGSTAFGKANGTGPFKLVEWVQDNRIVLEPYDGFWNADALKGNNVDKVVFTPIPNDATRVAALLSGEIDLMYPVPLQDVKRLNNDANTEAMEGPELRTIFLGFDQQRDELLDMPGSGKNPFKDLRVRQAFMKAIDINAIKRVVMRGASKPTALMIAEGINGFQKDMNDDRMAYDPDGAKALLAEAGYADGFPVTLDCPNDRYVNDEAICTAVVPMLERIGIKVTLNAQTKSLHFNKIGKPQDYNTSFFMLGWTPGSYDALNPLMQLMSLDGAGRGTWNAGRYSNPRVEELTTMIATEMDDSKRNEMIREAFKIHKDEVGHITLHQQALAWGLRTDTIGEVWQRPFNDVDLRYVVMK